MINVLYIDDEDDIRMIASMAMRNIGNFTVHDYADGANALNDLPNLTVDVVLSDLMMPNMDGRDILKAIKTTFNLPVIILTAKTDPDTHTELTTMGAKAIIQKPFDPMTLANEIREILTD